MQKILRKRIRRDLKENLLRYLALGLLIFLGMYLIVSLVGAAETVITGVEQKGEANRLEDGEFSTFAPLTEEKEAELRKLGITLERTFYLDQKQEDDSTLRLFQIRRKLNRIDLDEGRLAEGKNEVVLEKRYCAEQDLSIGDYLQIGGSSFQIVGIGSVPDYDAVFKNLSDSSVDSGQFGLVFVTPGAYETVKESGSSVRSEEYVYAYRLNGKLTQEELKDQLEEAQFLTASDNPRIQASADDQIINKMAGLIAGIIVMILFTYVISVFVIHGIERDSSIIGAFYSLGVRRRDLMVHYLMLPVLVTLLAGAAGTIVGFSKWGVNYQMKDCYDYFSLPELNTVYPLYLMIYGIVMPPVIAAAVNCIVIRRRLSCPALSLLRKEQGSSRISNLDLGSMGFIGRFRIRQMLRETRTGITVLFGMFLSLLIMMMGINCYVMCMHLSQENKADTKYEYMYTYKFPDEQVPDEAVGCFAKTLKKERFGYNLDITLLGIDRQNPYFDARVTEGKNKVIISSALSQKYQLHKGDKLILEDEEEGIDYAFTIEDITQYSTGLYAFMDIDSMRELYGKSQDYYNVAFADHGLPIDAGKLYAVVSKEEISKGSDVFVSMMMPMIYMMTSVSALIFCVVMYLMLKVMIDRSAFSISLMKVFGYRTGEIRRLHLNGSFYMVAAGAAAFIPLSKKLMDMMYPILVSNVACAMNLTFSWQLYLGIYAMILGLYLVINQLLVGKLKKLVPAEVLKNRE